MPERAWTTRTPEPGDRISAQGLEIICAAAAGAALISGDLEAAIAALAPGAPLLGLLERRPDGPFGLCIARDRALLCTADPLRAEGWQDGYAVSASDDLFLELTITGDRAEEIRSACMSAPPGSPSASTLFAAHGALVSALADGFSVRVQRPEAAAVWAHLHALSQSL